MPDNQITRCTIAALLPFTAVSTPHPAECVAFMHVISSVPGMVVDKKRINLKLSYQ